MCIRDRPIIGTITDEANGSGVDTSTVVVKVDGVVLTDVEFTPITNGYQFKATPATNYSNGQHTATVDAQDFDGNSATQKSVSFTVDTVPPSLTITSPTDNFVTNDAALTVIGTTNDDTSSPVSYTHLSSAILESLQSHRVKPLIGRHRS